MKLHTHPYQFDCNLTKGHGHAISGYCEAIIGTHGFHFHLFHGVSTYTDHTHYYCGITGLPLKTENGHIHRMNNVLESANAHEHTFKGHTFEEISYIRGNAPQYS